MTDTTAHDTTAHDSTSNAAAGVPADSTVRFDADTNRYIIELGGAYAGFSQVVLRNDQVVFIHTVIDEKFEGHGLGSRLIKAALEDVRDKGKRIVAVCPFVTAYLTKHPEWASLRDRPTSELLSSLVG
ncbi:GNAT family N-acetyltransferase [Naasia lichenicola]|uniref:N-acetyltransferase n=1 Tax=Naasia lichenicola TaxID=2565933 RepID=A0A4V3WTV2_9MICO|nr:GNAT family N-acetyltransferase [Naasia lichenicola]THG33397.1 N-acetyltransferase [Naasia lichenicola]